VSCKFSLNLPLFGVGPSSKGLGDQFKAFDQRKLLEFIRP
jgi:hypothetical protein